MGYPEIELEAIVIRLPLRVAPWYLQDLHLPGER